MYEQATFPIVNQPVFGAIHKAIETAFSRAKVAEFLKSVDRVKLRIRDFESVSTRSLLGEGIAEKYKQLESSDQCMIREFYLSSVEKVSPELRKKFLKIYAYY